MYHVLFILSGGFDDNSVKLISSIGAKTIETASRHCSPITCVALSPHNNYLVTKSQNATVILLMIHKIAPFHSRSISNPFTTSTIVATNGSPSSLGDTSRKRRIEDPIHVLRDHLREIVCCCVSFEMAIVVSCPLSFEVLLHSIWKSWLIRRLESMEAHSICVSPRGVIITWNQAEQMFWTFTINGIPIATASLSSFSGKVSCMEVYMDVKSILIGTPSLLTKDHDFFGSNSGSRSQELEELDLSLESHGEYQNRFSMPVPSICLMNLHTLKVFHTLALEQGQDITVVALNKDNTNILVSMADK